MLSNEFGFIFNYKKQKIIQKDEIMEITVKMRNNDEIPLFVNCVDCDTLMDFEVGPEDCLDGKWICPICKTKVREKTIYTQLDRENSSF